jgi:hypothetical protein
MRRTCHWHLQFIRDGQIQSFSYDVTVWRMQLNLFHYLLELHRTGNIKYTLLPSIYFQAILGSFVSAATKQNSSFYVVNEYLNSLYVNMSSVSFSLQLADDITLQLALFLNSLIFRPMHFRYPSIPYTVWSAAMF